MLIKNGIVSTASDTFIGDIRITNGLIHEIGVSLPANGEEIINASGLYVLPGGVDAHTHFDLDTGYFRAADDFYTGTIAACCGGTTTIIDHMGFGPSHCSLSHQLAVYHGLAGDKAVIDYGFHGVIQHVDDEVLTSMESLISEGLTSYKIYMTYDYKLGDQEIFDIANRSRQLGLMLTVHPENDGIIQSLRSEYLRNNLITAPYHAKSRPVECEAEAINRVLNICHSAGDAPIYIVHLSNGLGLDYINLAKARGQKNIFVETCPQYLFLNEELYNNTDGRKYIMSPPLRSKDNNELLWQGIQNGHINTIATDHCPFNYHEKQQAKDFGSSPNGSAGVECRIPLIFSEGVLKKRISINEMVALCSTNPAKLFGIYPQKGCISPGSDADLVLIDPNEKVIITKAVLHENVDYTPYEGIEVNGWPEMTISRGEIIAENGHFIGTKGRGRFLKRKRPAHFLR